MTKEKKQIKRVLILVLAPACQSQRHTDSVSQHCSARPHTHSVCNLSACWLGWDYCLFQHCLSARLWTVLGSTPGFKQTFLLSHLRAGLFI